MMLSDVRDYVESIELADHVYMGSLPDKQEKSIGVYNSKHQQEYKTALGGPQLVSYGTKYVTLLIHWNNSPRESEKTAMTAFDAVKAARNVTVNNQLIKFIQPLYEPQDVGKDDAGICEWVIEMAVIYEKGKGEKELAHLLQEYIPVMKTSFRLMLRKAELKKIWLILRTVRHSAYPSTME